MNFEQTFAQHDFVLAEGSVYERLRRHPAVVLDPSVAHAGVIYSETGARVLASIHEEYLAVAERAGVPMLVLTDTWRASAAQIAGSRFVGRDVNTDNVRFLTQLVKRRAAGGGEAASPVFIGGLLGPRGDAYRAATALPADAAMAYHAPQARALANAGVDFLLAATLPARSEALGMARAASRTSVPYLLSFVLRPDGTILDGTPLARAIEEIDAEAPRAPLAYSINCTHPSVVQSALRRAGSDDQAAWRRVRVLQANTSADVPEALDGRKELDGDGPVAFADAMWALQEHFPLRALGGCCGTDARHLEEVVARYLTARQGNS
jgi:homocysteine S-methyltransferase